MSHIQVISDFLNNNKKEISKIIKNIDPSYSSNVEWNRENNFSFLGKSIQDGDIYQLSLFSGKVYKNGKVIAALPEKIKENKYFKLIFKEDR